jgi:hypothetical protein
VPCRRGVLGQSPNSWSARDGTVLHASALPQNLHEPFALWSAGGVVESLDWNLMLVVLESMTVKPTSVLAALGSSGADAIAAQLDEKIQTVVEAAVR